MKQSKITLDTAFYCLQPGDGTRYEFFVTFPIIMPGIWEDDEGNAGWAEVEDVIRGLGPDFVLVGINMPGCQGIYPTSLRALKDLHRPHVMYMSNHMGGLYLYTVAAVLLAVRPRRFDRGS